MNKHHQSHPDIVRRLKQANGHLKKVIEMIEQGNPCLDVAQQIHAVSKAVEKAKEVYIRDHIEHCLDESMDDKSKRVHIAEFKEITKYL